jgi:hypothetical protein
MTELEAEKLSIALMQVVDLLDQTAAYVKDKDRTENWLNYRRAVGRAMAEIHLGLEEPLWQRFPNLRPDGFGGPYPIDPGTFEPRFYKPPENSS